MGGRQGRHGLSGWRLSRAARGIVRGSIATLVSSSSAYAQLEETVGVREVSRIGGLEDPYALIQVVQVATDEQGRLYALDRLDHTVKVFDPAGEFVTELGREGDGPGEFRRPLRMGLRGDTVWVLEPPMRRMSFLTLDRSVADSRHLLDAGIDREVFVWAPAGVLADGSTLYIPLLTGGAYTSGRVPTHVTLRRFAPDGAELEAVAELWTGRNSLVIAGERGGHSMLAYQPFNDATLWAIDSQGTFLVVVDRGESKAARGEVRVSVYGVGTGEWETWVGRIGEGQRIGSAAIDSVVDVAAEMIRSRGRPDIRRESILEALHNPGFVPPVHAALIDREGRVWLETRYGEDGRTRWDVYSREGRQIARVSLPSVLDVQHVVGGCVWGLERDDLDIQYIVQYEVQGVPDLACPPRTESGRAATEGHS